MRNREIAETEKDKQEKMNHPNNENNEDVDDFLDDDDDDVVAANAIDDDNADNDAAAPGIAAVAEDGDQEEEDEEDEDVDEDEAICQEAITLLQNRLKFHSRLRDRTMVRFARRFVRNVKNDIHKTITDTRTVEEGYDGLDSARDTEAEVETAIRSCPEVLTRRDADFGMHPIKCVSFMQGTGEDVMAVCNVKAVSFVPLFVRLAMEFNSFQDEERGGLLIEDGIDDEAQHVLHMLASHSDKDHHHFVDTTCLAVLIRLRQSGYFFKDDIQHFELVDTMCLMCQFEQRFHYMIEWDPSSLLHGQLLHHTVTGCLRSFRVVLDATIRFYPRWKGIRTLFQKENSWRGVTPFQLACDKLTRAAVMEVVEDILVRYTTNTGLVNNNNNGNAMVMAATDDTISLDGLYFSIRRQPDTMLSMLHHREEEEVSTPMIPSMPSSNNTSNINNRPANQKIIDSVVNNTDTNNTKKNTNNDENDLNNNHNNGELRRSTRKRKHN